MFTVQQNEQFAEFVILFVSVIVRDQDDIVRMILHVLTFSIDHNDLADIAVQILQVLDIVSSSPDHTFLSQNALDVLMPGVYVVDRVHQERRFFFREDDDLVFLDQSLQHGLESRPQHVLLSLAEDILSFEQSASQIQDERFGMEIWMNCIGKQLG